MIRVALVDDHPPTRRGLRDALVVDDEIEIIAEAGSSAELAGVLRRKPDVLLLDISMPQFHASQEVPKIRKQYPRTKIIIVTAFDNETFVQALLPHVQGYLLKSEDSDVYPKAVRAVVEGKTYFSERVFSQALSSTARPKLSEKELEVLTLAARGLSSAEIAHELYVSVRTVDSYVESACDKLNVRKRQAAIAQAVDLGLITAGSEEDRR